MVEAMAAVSLWRAGLTEVPDGVWRQESARALIPADDALTRLPREIGCLPGLDRCLCLHGNRLTALPVQPVRLSRLRCLNIGDNPFGHLPGAVCSMTALAGLGSLPLPRTPDLRANPLGGLPASPARLPAPEKLDLRWSGVPDTGPVVRELAARVPWSRCERPGRGPRPGRTVR